MTLKIGDLFYLGARAGKTLGHFIPMPLEYADMVGEVVSIEMGSSKIWIV